VREYFLDRPNDLLEVTLGDKNGVWHQLQAFIGSDVELPPGLYAVCWSVAGNATVLNTGMVRATITVDIMNPSPRPRPKHIKKQRKKYTPRHQTHLPNLTNNGTKLVNKQHQQFSQTSEAAIATVTSKNELVLVKIIVNAFSNKNYYEKCESESFEKIKKNFAIHADNMVEHCLLSSSNDKGDDASNKKYYDDIENIQIMEQLNIVYLTMFR